VLRVTGAAHQRERRGHEGSWQTPELKGIIARHTHTMREVTGNALEAHHTHDWHSNTKGSDLAGATGGALEDFMRDGLTWVNMPIEGQSQGSLVTTAIRAARSSTRPMRVVLLTRASTPIPREEEVRAHILANIPRGAIVMAKHTLAGQELLPNEHDLMVMVIECGMGPKVDHDTLRKEMALALPRITVHMPVGASASDALTASRRVSGSRNPAHKRSQLLWYRDEARLEKGELVDRNRSNALLWAMGIGPKNLVGTLTKHGVHPTTLLPEILTKVKARVRLTSFQAYTRQERWRVEKVRGYRTRAGDPRW
jgi:hypothetical protein